MRSDPWSHGGWPSEELVCRTTNCLYEDTPYDQNAILHVMLDADSLATSHREIRRYEDTPYDQNAILHVMLDADSLATSHREIRRILEERQAPEPMRPYLFSPNPPKEGVWLAS